MRLYFTGVSGQLGQALAAVCPTAVGWTRADLDLAGSFDLTSIFPTPPRHDAVVINAGAFTAVDAAEDPAHAENVQSINGWAPGELARQCAQLGIPMIHVSTDYVFSGRRDEGEEYRPSDNAEPVNEYGRSKLEGERAALAHGAFVVRTQWVYTGLRNEGKDFVKTMAGLASSGVDPQVVADQWGRPTYAPHLARGLVELAGALSDCPQRVPRILHCAGEGQPTTWYELAREVFATAGYDPRRVTPVSTREYPTPAPRPLNSVLSLEDWHAAGLTPLPAWRDGLREAVE